MPELPEVETVVSDLKEKIVGKKIIKVWSDWPKMIKNISFPELQKKLIDQKIERVARRGKNILIQVGRRATLVLHLKMTGHLLFRSQKFFPLDLDKLNKREKGSPFAQKVNQYIHFRFLFEKGKELAFSDMRKFGRIRFFQQPLAETLKNDDFKDLGPDPVFDEFNLKIFQELARQKRNLNKEVKVFLLDQRNISGIGNIYASEILFGAGLDPKKKVSELQLSEMKKIISETKRILKQAIKNRGTSISDFRDTDGQKGRFGDLRKVYQKKGESCPRCQEKIISIKQGQRSTFYCPSCQK